MRLLAPFDAADAAAARAFAADVPWTGRSTLTPTGAPVEVTYTGDLSELRVTVDRDAVFVSARWRAGVRTLKVYRPTAEPHPHLELSMAGDDERYGTVREPRPRTLHALLAAHGLAHRLPEFLDLFSFTLQRERAKAFHEVQLGAGVRPGCVTFYTPALRISRDRVSALAAALGQTFPAYDGTHCMLSITLDAAPTRCAIGVAP